MKRYFFKRFLSIALLALVSTYGFSQAITFRGQNVLYAGYNAGTATMKLANPVTGNLTAVEGIGFNHGFHIGLSQEIVAAQYIGAEVALQFATKGYSSKTDLLDTKVVSNNYYLELPITIKGGYVMDDVRVYGLFGPIFSVGLFGNTTISNKLGSETFKNFIKSEEGTTDLGAGKLRRFDVGLDLGVGADIIEMLSIRFHYVLGFVNQYKPLMKTEHNSKYKNGTIMLSLGFIL